MEKTMRIKRCFGTATGKRWAALLALLASLCFGLDAHAATSQRSFASPEDAVEALVKSAKANDRTAVLDVLGKSAGEWISSGDVVADRASVARFIAAYDAKHSIEKNDQKATLLLGDGDFPFAFPIVHSGERWHFDTAAGKEEMLARRIGDNELSTIQVLRAVVDAQMDYASADRNGDGVLAYAQKIVSTPGKHDGLYWPTKAGEETSPIGTLMANAADEGYRKTGEGPSSYHGYHFRLLKGQGPHAKSGALDYVIHGRAIGGFAAVAYPAKYGNSGIMSFIVNQDGQIYQADLGPNTKSRAEAMQLFDPGPGWSPVPAQ
jgi:hypothetical protein